MDGWLLDVRTRVSRMETASPAPCRGNVPRRRSGTPGWRRAGGRPGTPAAPALGVLDPDGHGGHVDLRRCERDYLGEAHAGVEAEVEGVARHRVAHRGLEAPVPARQHIGGRLDAAAVRHCSTGLRRSSKLGLGGSWRSWCRTSPMPPEAKRGNQARFGRQVSFPPLGLKLSPRRPLNGGLLHCSRGTGLVPKASFHSRRKCFSV